MRVCLLRHQPLTRSTNAVVCVAARGQAFSTRATRKKPSRNGLLLLVRRFINPWRDADPRTLGAERIGRYSEGFAVVSTLLCALSAAALASIPPQNRDKKQPSVLVFILRKCDMVSASSETTILKEVYTLACCTSFFSGACALGLSTAISVVCTVAPRNYTSFILRQHSLVLSAIPFFAVVSGGFMGLALITGIDMMAPKLTLMAMGQFGGTILLVAGTALRGQIGLVRAITASSTATKSNRLRRAIRARTKLHD